ncbi:MAG: GntR family transcriptional regulator [Vescimonas sp.]
MNLIISNASGKPIYEQIYTQVKNCIISGELSPGDALPSIRALAKDLRISVITTTRAYDELERDGFIDRVPGKGCYVAEKNLELVREAHLKQIEEHMTEIVSLAAGCSLSEEDTVQMLRLIWENEGKDDTF